MHTRNVNGKTAAPESTRKMGGETRAVYASAEWWAGALRSDGFVRNLHSSGEYDVISVKSLLDAFSKAASKGCGQHHEIYEFFFLDRACSYANSLPLSHRPAFYDAAAALGFNISDDAYDRSERTFEAKLEEINEENY
jgi:hypothetical protein